jgi:hypothetical protein
MNFASANSNRGKTNAGNLDNRCHHLFGNGTRCRLQILTADTAFCPRHARLGPNQPVEEDLSAKLLKNSQDFQTAQGINFALGNLYDLVAQNRIPTRRAAVLAYISSLLLRTLPAIDGDRENGITDPTKLAVHTESAALLIEPDPASRPS